MSYLETSVATPIDPVCGMVVDEKSATTGGGAGHGGLAPRLISSLTGMTALAWPARLMAGGDEMAAFVETALVHLTGARKR